MNIKSLLLSQFLSCNYHPLLPQSQASGKSYVHVCIYLLLFLIHLQPALAQFPLLPLQYSCSRQIQHMAHQLSSPKLPAAPPHPPTPPHTLLNPDFPRLPRKAFLLLLCRSTLGPTVPLSQPPTVGSLRDCSRTSHHSDFVVSLGDLLRLHGFKHLRSFPNPPF